MDKETIDRVARAMYEVDLGRYAWPWKSAGLSQATIAYWSKRAMVAIEALQKGESDGENG